jgi:hypothetical protein
MKKADIGHSGHAASPDSIEFSATFVGIGHLGHLVLNNNNNASSSPICGDQPSPLYLGPDDLNDHKRQAGEQRIGRC